MDNSFILGNYVGPLNHDSYLCGYYVVPLLNEILVFEWKMAQLGVKKEH